MFRMGARGTKLIVIGSSGVGKTCLVDRFLGNEYSAGNPPTTGANFSQIAVEMESGNEVLLNIWDTAGQEKFQSMAHSFYREAEVALICCSVKEPPHVLKKWSTAVDQHAPENVKKFIALTKADLIHSEDYLQDITSAVQELALELGVDSVFITSSLTGRGCSTLLTAIAEFIGSGTEESKNAVDPIIEPVENGDNSCAC